MSLDSARSRHASVISHDVAAGATQVRTVMLHGVPIVTLLMNGHERLCLAQISNTLLKEYSYNEIHNRRVALGITCIQCTPVQLELLRRAGAMPVSSRRCGMITRREAERLVKSFLDGASPPKLPDDFMFDVEHSCGWGCRGAFIPSRYNSSRAKCIRCCYCDAFFSPNKFIFHYHRMPADSSTPAVYNHPDAANFNSWRRHLKLVVTSAAVVNSSSAQLDAEVRLHAWEDVKAMFNGGSRRRVHHQHQLHARKSSSSHSTSHLIPPAGPPAAEFDAGVSDGRTSKPVNVDEKFRATEIKDAVQRSATTRDVIGGSRAVTSHGSTSSPTLRFTSCLPHADSHDVPLNPLMLQHAMPPTAFLAPPPPPYHPYHHLCPPAYMTSFSAPLYPVRPRPLAPMTHFRPTPFVGLQACGGGGGTSGVGYVETVDAGRRHPLQDTAAALVPWRPAVIHAQSPAAGVVDEQAPSASGMSSSSAADCGGVEDGLNRTVEELGTTADDCECECEHIDVDTVDDSSPQLSATIAAAETSPLPSSLSSSPSATAASALSATVAVEDLGMSSLAAHNSSEVDFGPVSNIMEERESPRNGVTTAPAENSPASDAIISGASSAMKRKATSDTQDADLQATKRRLETLLQLETHARRTIEENFKRVKEQLSDELDAKEKLRDSINRQLRIVKGSLFLELDHERKTRLLLEQQLKDAQQSLHSLTYGLCASSSSSAAAAAAASQSSAIALPPVSPQPPSVPFVNNQLRLTTHSHHRQVQAVLHVHPPFAS